MDDGIVVIRTGTQIRLISIGERNYLTEQFININDDITKMFKISSKKVLLIGNCKYIYNYKNKGLKLLESKELSIKSIGHILDIYIINEKEIALFYNNINNDYFLAFYDIEEDKIIESFDYKGKEAVYSLINENLLICGYKNAFFPINLINHKKEKEITLNNNNDTNNIDIYSIFSLNKNKFIVAQRGCIRIFEFKELYEFKCIQTIFVRNYAITKYLNNKFIFIDDKDYKTIHLYG